MIVLYYFKISDSHCHIPEASKEDYSAYKNILIMMMKCITLKKEDFEKATVSFAENLP